MAFVGPAGTGKSHTLAAFAEAYQRQTANRVIGLALSANAARVLASEGLPETHTIANFLGKIKDSDETQGICRCTSANTPMRPEQRAREDYEADQVTVDLTTTPPQQIVISTPATYPIKQVGAQIAHWTGANLGVSPIGHSGTGPSPGTAASGTPSSPGSARRPVARGPRQLQPGRLGPPRERLDYHAKYEEA
jgi:hypothetical protein